MYWLFELDEMLVRTKELRLRAECNIEESKWRRGCSAQEFGEKGFISQKFTELFAERFAVHSVCEFVYIESMRVVTYRW